MALAAFRYASSSVADSVWASAMLSKLALTGSSGSQSPASTSSDSRSRDGLRVLRAVEPLEGPAAGVGSERGGRVEAALQSLDEREQRAAVRPAGTGRRHHAGPQLADHPLGDVGVLGRVCHVEPLQRQVAAQRTVVVARPAGAAHDAVGLGVGPGGLRQLHLRGRRRRRGRSPRGGYGRGEQDTQSTGDGSSYSHGCTLRALRGVT